MYTVEIFSFYCFHMIVSLLFYPFDSYVLPIIKKELIQLTNSSISKSCRLCSCSRLSLSLELRHKDVARCINTVICLFKAYGIYAFSLMCCIV